MSNGSEHTPEFGGRAMVDDDGSEYTCGPDACGYTGDSHCQNCGYARNEH